MAQRRAEYFDGKVCVKCGSSERLELDHIDPSTKVTNSIWSWSEIRRNEEIAKCQVLCYDCHREKTQVDLGYKFLQHGTKHMYRTHKCRCGECRAWNSARVSAERARRRARENN